MLVYHYFSHGMQTATVTLLHFEIAGQNELIYTGKI